MACLTLIQTKLENQDPVLLMLDYDGTLTPIVELPEKAVLDPLVRLALEKLATLPNVTVAVISGRRVESILAVSGLSTEKNLFYGLHGGESLDAGSVINQATITQKANIQSIRTLIEQSLKTVVGVHIEDKGSSVAVHFREVHSNSVIESIEARVFSIFASSNNGHQLRLLEGKKVLEILPAQFNKSHAVETLMQTVPTHYPVYFGDDTTDLDALAVVLSAGGSAIGVVEAGEAFISENPLSGIVSRQALVEFLIAASNQDLN
jgi:trehalose 6-phosphate phosphatase